MTRDESQLTKALDRAFSLGQTYWQQADSESYSQNRKSDDTLAKFRALKAEVLALRSQDEPVAHVPIHPRSGPLWMDTFAHDVDVSQSRPRSYPTMALYASAPSDTQSPVEGDTQREPRKPQQCNPASCNPASCSDITCAVIGCYWENMMPSETAALDPNWNLK